MAHQSRRGFLAYLGLAGASTAAATVTVAIAPVPEPEELGRFESPAEYLAAMRAIGWEARAMFHPLPDGSVHRMGVTERH